MLLQGRKKVGEWDYWPKNSYQAYQLGIYSAPSKRKPNSQWLKQVRAWVASVNKKPSENSRAGAATQWHWGPSPLSPVTFGTGFLSYARKLAALPLGITSASQSERRKKEKDAWSSLFLFFKKANAFSEAQLSRLLLKYHWPARFTWPCLSEEWLERSRSVLTSIFGSETHVRRGLEWE